MLHTRSGDAMSARAYAPDRILGGAGHERNPYLIERLQVVDRRDSMRVFTTTKERKFRGVALRNGSWR